MKSRMLIILSALALLVLLALQYFFITDTYSTKEQQLNDRYAKLAREAQGLYAQKTTSRALDSVLFLLDEMAVNYLFGDPDSLESCLKNFQQVLQDHREPELFTRNHILNAGETGEFDYLVHVKELHLLDLDYEIQLLADTTELPDKDALMTGSFTRQRNFYRISYETYIDFRNRTSMVLREMWLILGVTLVMLALVFTVFILTLGNMLRQKRLSEMKSDFINNMTHELKTPLSTIAVASASLGNKKIIQDEKKVEKLSLTIKKQNRHLSDLIDRILDIRIWEKDQVRLQKEEVEIGPWVGELCDAFRIQNPEAELLLREDIQMESLAMDEVHMTTALNNLLSNAVRYGGDPCRIELLVKSNEDSLEISVLDNGPGFRRDEQRHLFEKFYRGGEAKKRVVRGLGLGLYYVKQIVEAHNGTINAQSEEGRGASFLIKIPI